MKAGPEGRLFVLGNLDGTEAGTRLMRLDGSQLTVVASPPHLGGNMALGPFGQFYVTGAHDYGSGHPIGEVWTVDPTSGSQYFVCVQRCLSV